MLFELNHRLLGLYPLSLSARFPTSPGIDPTRLFQRPSPFLTSCYVRFNGYPHPRITPLVSVSALAIIVEDTHHFSGIYTVHRREQVGTCCSSLSVYERYPSRFRHGPQWCQHDSIAQIPRSKPAKMYLSQFFGRYIVRTTEQVGTCY